MRFIFNLARLGLRLIFGAFTLGVLAVALSYLYLAPQLPSIDILKDIQLQTPLRVYTKEGKLIAEYGEKRRSPLRVGNVPKEMIHAVLAAEDDRFFEHPGVDYRGILRAVVHLMRTGEKGQGGSTITMQVARNFFLSREKTFLRKLNEIFLALKIERELSKEDILELYLNKIYFGHRAYGVAAAAQVYYGKTISELTVPEMAMIAGLPKAPSRFNPIVNSQRALIRRGYVLGRMHALGYIGDAQYEYMLNEPDTASLHKLNVEVEAPYVGEMVRAQMVERYGDTAYTAGYRVYTTIDTRMQRAANNALRQALQAYDMRHGYRGRIGGINLTEQTGAEQWEQILGEYPSTADLLPAVVLAAEEQQVRAYVRGSGEVDIQWQGLSWARRYISENRLGPEPQKANEIVRPGDIVHLLSLPGGRWRLAQIPQAEGALVSLRPTDGAIYALVGGYDFYQSKFNRVIQAGRQPGSNFKPFIYSAALEKGYTTASIINDAPVVFDDPGLESAWRPENYSGKFYGPTRLRVALINSRNLVSIRLMRAIGIPYAIDYVARFGFDTSSFPRDLSLSLGSGTVSPLSIARGYSVFANSGYLVDPYLIDRIEDIKGNLVMQVKPRVVCRTCDGEDTALPGLQGAPDNKETRTEQDEAAAPVDFTPPEPVPAYAPRVITPQNSYLMTTIMRDVISFGTGRGALRIGRKDLAGKTGTTNDQRDAWFSGFNPDIVTTAWVGFDQVRSLGDKETGARAALPMWVEFMQEALRGVPEKPLERPPGLVNVRIDRKTGLLADSDNKDARFEIFRKEYVPSKKTTTDNSRHEDTAGTDNTPVMPEQLF